MNVLVLKCLWPDFIVRCFQFEITHNITIICAFYNIFLACQSRWCPADIQEPAKSGADDKSDALIFGYISRLTRTSCCKLVHHCLLRYWFTTIQSISDRYHLFFH
ncbi:hypothetical protein CW304_04590 [Bacillus sp. UFRGS-B20]|nr:hypothetical protein CW304_04590 [Bacillus sp. UFRGS-B20]